MQDLGWWLSVEESSDECSPVGEEEIAGDRGQVERVGAKNRAFRSIKETVEEKDEPRCGDVLTKKAPYKRP